MASGLREFGGPRGSVDDTVTVGGEGGIGFLQRDGELVVQTDTEGAQKHIDVSTVGITDTEELSFLEVSSIGQTELLSGILESTVGEPFTVHLIWLADDGSERVREEFSNDSRFDLQRVFTKAEDVEFLLTDESSGGVTNAVEGTLNFR